MCEHGMSPSHVYGRATIQPTGSQQSPGSSVKESCNNRCALTGGVDCGVCVSGVFRVEKSMIRKEALLGP